MVERQSKLLKLSVLTPLHIGNGIELLHKYDYAIHKGYTWRINEAAFLEAQDISDPRIVDVLAKTPPVDRIDPKEYHLNNPIFRYVIKGTPRSEADGAQVREQIKDTYDRLYIPGSSVKGAIRTMLAWYAWKEENLKPDFSKLGRNSKFAAQEYEHLLFGPNPNKDTLRALHISDSKPLPVGENLLIMNARVHTKTGKPGAPIEVEAVKPDTSFDFTLKVDQVLFSDWAKARGLNLRGEHLLSNLPGVMQAYARDYIQNERTWYRGLHGATRVVTFYEQLLNASLAENQFLLQLGWGTGWSNKTLGSRLQADASFMQGIIAKYRLGRGSYDRETPFPKSRRMTTIYAKDQQGRIDERIAYPPGWVLAEVN